jgi:dethiobiotin synthetase
VRPRHLVLVLGTGTEVGKTWVSARLLRGWHEAGLGVAARKPAQSYESDDDPSALDAALLGAASGEAPEVVCPPHRWYPVAMAPTMAAMALGREGFTIGQLVAEITWPETDPVDVGLIESAGGVRSPLADDGDSVTLCEALHPDLVLLIADAGLGTINAVRLSLAALPKALVEQGQVIVVLNRFDPSRPLHLANRDWLVEQDRTPVLVMPGDEEQVLSWAAGDARETRPPR